MSEADSGFETLAQTIADLTKLRLDGYKIPCIKRRIAVRMRASGISDYREYSERLRDDPVEVARLRAVLTVNVTTFFRNPSTWEHLASAILPEVLRAAHGRVRMWSAGCASGEEPYTLAMLAADVVEKHGEPPWHDRMSIDATDIDAESLARARRARYPRSAFREAPAGWLDRYAEAVGDDVILVESIRRLVRIARLDLTRDAAPHPPYDLILCRNVLIYFDRPMQERLFSVFTRELSPGGILVLGKVETVWGESRERLEPLDIRERIFRRSA